jgi:hypothetical protein
MIATVTYSSLAAFYEAHHGEIDSAVTQARDAADRLVCRLPCGLDEDAFRGEAALAVWLAALAYRPELGSRSPPGRQSPSITHCARSGGGRTG